MNYMILQLKLFSLIEIIPSGDEWGSLLDFLNYVFDSLIILLFYFQFDGNVILGGMEWILLIILLMVE